MLTQRVACLGAASFVVSTLAATVANAVPVTYTINPAQSSLTIGGTLIGNTPTAQTAGSLTTSFSGTIAANRTATTIEFPGGSTLDAALQPSNQQPRTDTTPGSQPADYGRTTFVGSPFFVDAFEAFRNVVLDVFDDTSGAGSTVSGSNTFNSANLGLEFVSGESDVAYGTAGAENDFAFPTALGNMNTGSTAASSVVVSGGIETLTLRFNTGPISYSVSSTNDSSVTFTGTIVATRAVPEPAGALAVAGAAGLLALRRRRRGI